MADIDYDDYGASPRISGGQVQRLIHLGGAACSVALIAGMGLWGYKLAVRDATGVPVIRAADGPMRVPPSNPGGNFVDHQGMAVNEIAAVGGAGALPAQVILAPAAKELAAEDAAGLASVGALAQAAGVEPAETTEAVRLAVAPLVAVAAPVALMPSAEPMLQPEQDAAVVATEDAVAMALAEALGDAVPLAPLADLQPAPAQLETVSAEPVAGAVRPRARPSAGFAKVEVSAVQPVNASVVVGPEIDPATLTAGTRLVQLGAFDSPEIARAEWGKLRNRFGDLMTGKSLVVQAAQSGGRTFYRLRAHGFGGEDDARRFCSALLAENAACIPVAHR
ncbi:MAG: SPOR domain-containing protein [Paracoccaceae bacterium]